MLSSIACLIDWLIGTIRNRRKKFYDFFPRALSNHHIVKSPVACRTWRYDLSVFGRNYTLLINDHETPRWKIVDCWRFRGVIYSCLGTELHHYFLANYVQPIHHPPQNRYFPLRKRHLRYSMMSWSYFAINLSGHLTNKNREKKHQRVLVTNV